MLWYVFTSLLAKPAERGTAERVSVLNAALMYRAASGQTCKLQVVAAGSADQISERHAPPLRFWSAPLSAWRAAAAPPPTA